MTEIAMGTGLDSVANDSNHVTSHLRLVPAPTTKTEQKQAALRRVTAIELDVDLEWLLTCGAVAMGERGTTGSVISQIERGSVGGTGNLDEAGCYSHQYTDLQLALGSKVGIGDVERHRWLSAAWHKVPREMRGVLGVRYSAPPATFRSDRGYGAKDRYIQVVDGASAAVAARTASGQMGGQGAIEREQANAERRAREARHTGVEGFLGELAGLSFAICPDAAKLLLACQEPDPQLARKDGSAVVNKDGVVSINRSLQGERRKLRNDALRLARAADAEAHQCWAEAKASVASARTWTERVGFRPEKVVIDVVFHDADSRRAQRRDPVKVDEATFGERVREALVASGRIAAPRRLMVVSAAAPSAPPVQSGGVDMEALRVALLAEQAPQRGGGLLGLLNAHADEAL